MPYLGASPRNINTRSVIDHQEYLGSQADTSTNSGYYTFYVNYTPGNVSVVIRGVHMASSDYTATNGTDVRISTSTITLANDDVIEIIGYGIPSSQILERSDVNITGGQAINLTQVGASSYKVGNTEVIDSSGNLISGTLGANVSFANIADDAISGDKIHSGTISSSTLDGIKLKSSGNSITASDGTTSVLSESAGVVTLNNVTLNGDVSMASSGLTVRNITTVAKSSDTGVENSASLTTFFTPTYTPLFAGSKVLGILTFKGVVYNQAGAEGRKRLHITLIGSGITTIRTNHDEDLNLGIYDYGGSGVQLSFHQSITLPLVTTSTTDVITATCALQNDSMATGIGWAVTGNNTLEETFMTWMEFK